MTLTVRGTQGDEVKQLRNPDNVSTAAIQDGLDLYRRLIQCENPVLKQPIQSAMQVRAQELLVLLILPPAK